MRIRLLVALSALATSGSAAEAKRPPRPIGSASVASPAVPHSAIGSAGAGGVIQPAPERLIAPGASSSSARLSQPPRGEPARLGGGELGPTGIRGLKIPEVLRAGLRARLDERALADLVQMKQLRQEAIQLLQVFIDETPIGARDMPEALVRLGELQWENEREAFVERFQAWEKRPIAQRGRVPTLDYQVPRALFARVLRDYTWFDQYDLALYADGFLAFEQGQEDEARDRFERILREYPWSRFAADAHMAKAEAIFNGSLDYAAALVEYENVLALKGQVDPSLYGLALFKSAWCYWRLGNNDEAARRFVGVFETADAHGSPAPVSAAERQQLSELQGEALKYVVEVFSEDEKNTAKDLFKFLAKIGGERFSGTIVRALAEQFYANAHFERGIEAYELLLKLEPTSRDAGRWVLDIVAGYDAMEDWSHSRATFERALREYVAGGPWSRTQADPAHVAATTDAIEKALRDDARALHSKAQRDKTSVAEFESAASLYGVYLWKFAGQPKAYEVHFDLAEIDFFRLGKNLDAATHYMAAARAIPPKDTTGPLATMRHDALYNALVALSREMNGSLKGGEKGEAKIGEGDGEGSARVADAYAEALTLYAQYYPGDSELPAMFYRQGRHYFDGGNYDSAVKIWGLLIEKFPDSDPSRDAGDSILESFSRAKNYENIETWARRLKALPSFRGAKQQERLDALIVVAVFKQGEQKASAGDHAAAASAYLRAAKEFPNDTRAARACVNAEQEAKLAGDVNTLEEAAQLAMGPRYASRPESPTGAWIATTTLQAMGLFGAAADLAERMVSLGDRDPNYAKFEHEKDAAYNAVVLREATGNHERAVADGARFLATYGNTPEADEVVFQVGRANESAGHPREAAGLYQHYLVRAKNLDHRIQGFVLLAQIDLKSGDEKRVATSLDEALVLARQHGRELGPDGRYAAAHARYMQGERVLARFEQIQIQGDVKQLKARLKQKAELLKDAAKVFLSCVVLGVAEWTTAALFQIGHMYEAFAKTLRDSPPPSEIKTEDQRAEYQSQIEEFAVPMEERSLDAYENGWKKATDLGIYNQWTAKMRDALGRLNTELYPPFKETGFEVRSQGPLPMPPLIEVPNGSVAPLRAPPRQGR